jgi:hypothetical protein
MANEGGAPARTVTDAKPGASALRHRAVVDALILLTLALPFYLLAREYDFLEHIAAYTRAHEEYELDELFSLAVFVAILLIFYSVRRLVDLLGYARKLREANLQLSQTLEEISRLRRLLPICAGCKKVRNDEGYWQEVDAYLARYHLARITHGLCPDCMAKYYPEVAAEVIERESQASGQ